MLAVNVAACAVVLVTAVVIAAHNLGSRNIALGTGAVSAAIVGFLLQLAFDLQRSTTSDQVSFSYTFDFGNGGVRQWDYSKVASGDVLSSKTVHAGMRIHAEIEAGKWLFSNRRELIKNHTDKVASDLAILSVVAFIGSAGRDWQWEFKRFNSSVMSHGSIRPVSKAAECAYVQEDEVRKQLAAAGNVFADVPSLFFSKICLPPTTKLRITPSELTLTNPVCQIRFALADTGAKGASHVEPGSNFERFPKLPNGEYRYDTLDRSFDIDTTVFPLRSQSRSRANYEIWMTRLIEYSRQWFACC